MMHTTNPLGLRRRLRELRCRSENERLRTLRLMDQATAELTAQWGTERFASEVARAEASINAPITWKLQMVVHNWKPRAARLTDFLSEIESLLSTLATREGRAQAVRELQRQHPDLGGTRITSPRDAAWDRACRGRRSRPTSTARLATPVRPPTRTGNGRASHRQRSQRRAAASSSRGDPSPEPPGDPPDEAGGRSVAADLNRPSAKRPDLLVQDRPPSVHGGARS